MTRTATNSSGGQLSSNTRVDSPSAGSQERQVVVPKDAATIILVDQRGDEPKILMGQRGSGASFMPSKFVFPGGALDPSDIDLARALDDQISANPACEARLAKACDHDIGKALALAAIRETFQETGLLIGKLNSGKDIPEMPDWAPYQRAGLFPDLSALRYIFRAITPHYRPKRFDARFFLTDASQIINPLNDFSAASGELSHLSWLTIRQARALELPLITEVVLAEVDAILKFGYGTERAVPFFHHANDWSRFDAL